MATLVDQALFLFKFADLTMRFERHALREAGRTILRVDVAIRAPRDARLSSLGVAEQYHALRGVDVVIAAEESAKDVIARPSAGKAPDPGHVLDSAIGTAISFLQHPQ